MFGSTYYVMVNLGDPTKLNPQSRKCSFVGYESDEFGYRYYDHENRKIIRSKDIVFNKAVLYKNWKRPIEKQTKLEN